MKMMLSVLSAERYLPMMRMGFGNVVMAVTVGVTLVVRLCPVKKPCLNSPFVGAALSNCDFHNLFRQQLFCFEDFVMCCA